MFSIGVAVILFLLGCFGMFTVGFLAGYIISFWLIVFGPLLVAAELKQKHVMKFFKFMRYRSGRGVMCIFLGTLGVAVGGMIGWIGGAVGVGAGILMILFAMHWRRHRKARGLHDDEEDDDVELASQKQRVQPNRGGVYDSETSDVRSSQVVDNYNNHQQQKRSSNAANARANETQENTVRVEVPTRIVKASARAALGLPPDTSPNQDNSTISMNVPTRTIQNVARAAVLPAEDPNSATSYFARAFPEDEQGSTPAQTQTPAKSNNSGWRPKNPFK